MDIDFLRSTRCKEWSPLHVLPNANKTSVRAGDASTQYSKTAFYRYLGIPFLYGILVNSQEQLILL